MPDLVRDVVNVKRIPHWRVGARLALGLEAGNTDNADAGQPSAGRAEDVADIVALAANYRIEVLLVLRQQRQGVAVTIRLRDPVRINDQVVIGRQHQPDSQFRFIYSRSPG